jgi:hypothetical protein
MVIIDKINKDPQCNDGIMKCLKTIEGKKGIFSILLIAIILTVYEIVFFYKIISPSITDTMNNNLDDVSKQIYANIKNIKYEKKEAHTENISKISKIFDTIQQSDKNNINIIDKGLQSFLFNDKIKAFLNTFSNREKNLTDHINKYTMLSGLLLLTILIVLMVLLWKNIKNSELGENENYNMTTSIKTAFFTVFILISFQILFFFFGKKYYFPGSVGDEELTSLLLKRINIE